MKTIVTVSILTQFGRALRALALGGLLLPLGAAAQSGGPGRVSGRLAEAGSGQAVPFSDVLLLRAADSTFVAVAQTTEEGAFQAAALPLGTYILRVQDLNYRVLRRRFSLTAEAPTAGFPRLEMTAAAATRLGEVVVTGQQAVVVEDLGKRVINVEKDLGSVGGTAVNVLQNVPSIAVDASGVVSMRGSSNLTILIDGKPAGTANGGTGARLDQLPASQIAQIEIMTNPSAKYDAAGAGVINIITKKEKKNGYNGQVGLVAGTGDKYAPTLSLSRRQGKANWNLGYNGRDQRYRETTDNAQVATLPDGQVVRAQQVGTGLDYSASHRLSVGLDYQLDKETSLGFNVTPALEKNGEVNQSQLTQQAAGGATTRLGQQTTNVDVKVLNASTDFRRTWAAHEGRELSANAGWVLIDALVPVTQTLTGANPTGWRQEISANINLFFGQLDYVHPLASGKGRLETGLKLQATVNEGAAAMQRLAEGRPDEYEADPARSVAYHYRELLPAAYATFQYKLGKAWNAQGGLRTEYTTISGDLKNRGGDFAVRYLSLFPSATLSRDLGQKPGAQKVQASYARRLNRPNFMQQLPFQFYQDPLNYSTGDPNLRAEFSHNAELGYQLNLAGGAAFTTTLFARFTEDAIQRVRGVDLLATERNNGAGLVTVETYRNNGRTTNVGAEMTWSQPLAAWWRVAANGSLYRSEIATNGLGAANRHVLAGTVRLTNNFQPTKTLDVQLTGSFRSVTLTAQGRQLPTGGLDLALRQRLFGDRAAVTLRVSDLFDTQVRNSEIDTPSLRATYRSKYETRVAWAGFTWYLGASKPAKRIEAAPQGGGGFGG